jgi:hypothetical protein
MMMKREEMTSYECPAKKLRTIEGNDCIRRDSSSRKTIDRYQGVRKREDEEDRQRRAQWTVCERASSFFIWVDQPPTFGPVSTSPPPASEEGLE